ncbi:unnamed protein product [Hyaloperonospora brassicae]|uniref:RxLR effector candidate protein n=1 Tax=Hyaloperonospora brassicae TaxID=162125 RepID=A0AAV0ULD1_HYABA|nr:unnamed protein product [Hyaloperonospora brassicae]
MQQLMTASAVACRAGSWQELRSRGALGAGVDFRGGKVGGGGVFRAIGKMTPNVHSTAQVELGDEARATERGGEAETGRTTGNFSHSRRTRALVARQKTCRLGIDWRLGAKGSAFLCWVHAIESFFCAQ